MEKTKGTLSSKPLKVGENKVPLVFSILSQGLRYNHFPIFCQPRQDGAIQNFKKWTYLSL